MPQSAVVGGAQWSYGVWVGLILYPSITYALDSYLHSRSVTPPPTPPPTLTRRCWVTFMQPTD